mmetsp:Transcript_5862/g.12884  ORF Transcript_5862/g.12884 Transcript_5862/m.12884 type:complete len:571 (-) Transcript_5862:324-2036(-)
MADVDALQDQIKALEAQLQAAQAGEDEEVVEEYVIEEVVEDGDDEEEYVEEIVIEEFVEDGEEYEEVVEEVYEEEEEEEEPAPAAVTAPPSSSSNLSAAQEAEAAPYRKMLKMGLPDQMVRLKMGAAGVDESIIQSLVGSDEPPPKRGAAPAPRARAAPAAAPKPSSSGGGRPALDLSSVTLKKTTPNPPAAQSSGGGGGGGRPKIDLASVNLKKTGVKLVEEEPETSWKKNWGAPKAQPAAKPTTGPAPKAQPAAEAPKPKAPPKNFFEQKQRQDPAIAKATKASTQQTERDPDAGMKVKKWVPMSERNPEKFKKNSKEVLDAGKKTTTTLAPLPFRQRPYPSDAASPSGSESAIEKMLGSFLYKNVKFDRVTVNAAMKDQDILLLYFGAGWRSGCKKFNPKIIDFYKLTSKDCALELVYVSADRTMFEFKDLYNRFPFLAMPTGTVDLKNQMTKDFKVVDMPALVVLNAQTGNLISANAAEEINSLANSRDREAAQNVVNGWKASKSVPVKPPGAKGAAAPEQAAPAAAKPTASSSSAKKGAKKAAAPTPSGAVGTKEKKGILFWKKQ